MYLFECVVLVLILLQGFPEPLQKSPDLAEILVERGEVRFQVRDSGGHGVELKTNEGNKNKL